MKLQEIKDSLLHSNLSKVSKASGVHYNGLTRLMKGETDPRYSTVEALRLYLEARKNGENI